MELTPKQQQILGFLESSQREEGRTPSVREIARHFGWTSPGTVADHLTALRKKGALEKPSSRRARSFRVSTPLNRLRPSITDIPVYGEIDAGFAQTRTQEPQGCISVGLDSLNIRKTARTFALQVRGDSMIGKYILDGDYAIFEHGVTPRWGDVVAALIDNESTLKTYVTERGKPYLKAENPKYPKLIPATELVIQGVMVALVRTRRTP